MSSSNLGRCWRTNPSRLHVYLRASTKKQSYRDQWLHIEEWLNINGNKINDMKFIDGVCVSVHKSAWVDYDPKELRELIDMCGHGDCIVVYMIDRLGRNVGVCRDLIERLHRKKGFIYSISDKISSYEERFFDYLKAAEINSEWISIRSKDRAKLRRRSDYNDDDSDYSDYSDDDSDDDNDVDESDDDSDDERATRVTTRVTTRAMTRANSDKDQDPNGNDPQSRP